MFEFLPRVKHFYEETLDDVFSYNLSRRPHFGPGFKNIVFFFCCCLFVILTIFNLATNGFDRQTTYSIHVNSTQDAKYWYNNVIFTWGDDHLDPKCESVEIPVGYQFMTSNLGLRYTVTDIVLKSESGPTEKRPSVSYLNNTLTDCQVDSVDIYLKKSDNSIPFNDWWSWVDSSADATAHCDVVVDEGKFSIFFTVTYQSKATLFDPISVSALYSFVGMDYFDTHASVWWGTRMLTRYFVGVQYVMAGEAPKSGNNPIPRAFATISFHRTNNTSIMQNDIFGLEYYFMNAMGDVLNTDTDHSNVNQVYNNETFELSRPLTESLWFARVFYSLVLVDLGNSQTPNILTNESLLQYTLNSTNNFNRHETGPLANISAMDAPMDEWKFAKLSPPDQPKEEADSSVLMSESYSKFKELYKMGRLGTNVATIYAQYLCSVPQKKSSLSVVLLVLTANFALFHTFWSIFKLLMAKVSTRTPLAMYCEGCLSQDHHLASMEEGANGLVRPSRAGHIRRTRSRASSMKGLLKYQQLDDDDKHLE